MPGLGKQAVVAPALGDHGEQLITVDQMAMLVGDQHAVGIAVERDADIGSHLAHLAAERFRRRRPAIVIDVEAVGFDADRHHVGAEFPECVGRNAVCGAVGAVDDDAQAIKRKIARQGALGEFNVAVMHAIDALGAAEIAAGGEPLGEIGRHELFDLVFGLVGQLVAVGPEQLDAVVVERVMRRRNHDPKIGAHRTGQHGDRRGRHRAKQQHVHADRGETGHQRSLDHVAGQPGILADHHAMPVLTAAKGQPRRLPHLQRQFRRNHAIRAAANAVRAEMLTNHCLVAPPQYLLQKAILTASRPRALQK